MSEIKQINTGLAELLVVKVPEGASDFCVPNDIYLSSLPVLQWWISKNGIVDGVGSTTLPPGNWTPLSIDTELTEEQCREVMPKSDHYRGVNDRWVDYTQESTRYAYLFKTAKEAFASLMQANECYTENPCEEKPKPFSYVKWEVQARAEAEWQQAQANTGTWLVLKRLS